MRTVVLDRLKDRFGSTGAGLYAAGLSLVVLGIAGLVGLGLGQPWLFPSLGPTVMLFFETPEQPSARPVNALAGHLVGIGVGWAMLHAFRLADAPPAPVGGLTAGHVAAGALSVAVTSLVLVAVGRQHPPAGASTLIVSLGILHAPPDLGVMVLAVLLVTALGWALNVVLGQPARRATG